MTFVLPEWECLRAALPRWVLLYDLICSYHPLPLCQSRSGVAESPSTGTLLNAASEAMPLFRTQSAAKQSSLAPHDSKARLIVATTRRRFMAKPCTPHLHCAARAVIQAVSCQCRGSRGAPFVLSLGGVRGIFSFREREYPPLTHSHTVWGQKQRCRAAPPLRPTGAKRNSPRGLLSSRA